MTQHQRELLHTLALEAAVPFQCRALCRSAVLGSTAGELLEPRLSPGSPSPHCANLSELVQVCPTLHHKHDVNIFQLLICDIYQPMFFSKALQKPLHKHNQNITCRRGKLFHWEVIFKKQTNKPQILMSTLPPCKSGVEMKNINIQLP